VLHFSGEPSRAEAARAGYRKGREGREMTELGNLLRDLATLNGAIALNRMHLHQRSPEEI